MARAEFQGGEKSRGWKWKLKISCVYPRKTFGSNVKFDSQSPGLLSLAKDHRLLSACKDGAFRHTGENGNTLPNNYSLRFHRFSFATRQGPQNIQFNHPVVLHIDNDSSFYSSILTLEVKQRVVSANSQEKICTFCIINQAAILLKCWETVAFLRINTGCHTQTWKHRQTPDWELRISSQRSHTKPKK